MGEMCTYEEGMTASVAKADFVERQVEEEILLAIKKQRVASVIHGFLVHVFNPRDPCLYILALEL